jgi:hypothetical protein
LESADGKMNATGKTLQVLTAGAGFLAGYLWSVARWAGAAVGPRAEGSVLGSAAGCGVLLALAYVLLLGGLFWPWIPCPKRGGLRIVVAPTAFTLSFLLGAVGIQAALWALGSR